MPLYRHARKKGKNIMNNQQGNQGNQNYNNQGQQRGYNNGYGGGGQRNYEWLTQQRLREQMKLNQLLLREQQLQQTLRHLQEKRDDTVANKLGLSVVAGIAVLSGLKQVTMLERTHLYKMQRFDQEESRSQILLQQVEQDILAVQANLDLIDFEIQLANTGTNTTNNRP